MCTIQLTGFYFQHAFTDFTQNNCQVSQEASIMGTSIINFICVIPYFFGYKTVLSSKAIPKNVDPSYKMTVDHLGLFRKGKTCF